MAQGTVVVMNHADILGVAVVARLVMAVDTGGAKTGHPARRLVIAVVGGLGGMAADTRVGRLVGMDNILDAGGVGVRGPGRVMAGGAGTGAVGRHIMQRVYVRPGAKRTAVAGITGRAVRQVGACDLRHGRAAARRRDMVRGVRMVMGLEVSRSCAVTLGAGARLADYVRCGGAVRRSSHQRTVSTGVRMAVRAGIVMRHRDDVLLRRGIVAACTVGCRRCA